MFNHRPCDGCGEQVGAIAPAMPSNWCTRCSVLAAKDARIAELEAALRDVLPWSEDMHTEDTHEVRYCAWCRAARALGGTDAERA